MGKVRKYRPADRQARLLAKSIDFSPLIIALAILPFRGLLGSALNMAEGFLAILYYALGWANFILMWRSGQTVGKRMMGLRVIGTDPGGDAGVSPSFMMRSIFFLIPFIVFVIAWANGDLIYETFALFLIVMDVSAIFGKDRKCLHDRASGTWVVEDGGVASGGLNT